MSFYETKVFQPFLLFFFLNKNAIDRFMSLLRLNECLFHGLNQFLYFFEDFCVLRKRRRDSVTPTARDFSLRLLLMDRMQKEEEVDEHKKIIIVCESFSFHT